MQAAAEAAHHLLDQSDGDEDEEKRKHGGSVRGKAPNKKRDFEGAYDRLVKNYFNGTESIYDEKQFARRFRMPREVFNRIKDRIIGQGTFVDKVDMFGNPTIRPLVLLVACLDHYAFGTAADHADAPYAISESTLNQSAKEFCALMIASFGNEYLCRIPSVQERARILSINEERGFPGMFASWDCKHFGL